MCTAHVDGGTSLKFSRTLDGFRLDSCTSLAFLANEEFSLIELLIIVAIILIVAAIAIRNLLRSRVAANEASAVGSIRTVNTATITYNSVYGNGYPPALASLSGTGTVTCTNAEIVDTVLGGGTKSGYTFAMVHGVTILNSTSSSWSGGYGYSDGYVVTVTPVTTGTTGQRCFCSDATGVIRYNSSGAASYTTPYWSTALSVLQ